MNGVKIIVNATVVSDDVHYCQKRQGRFLTGPGPRSVPLLPAAWPLGALPPSFVFTSTGMQHKRRWPSWSNRLKYSGA